MTASLSALILLQTSLAGDIRPHLAFESKALNTKRDFWVYLPREYEKEPKRRFPVLYLGDGQNVFDGETAYIKGKEWRVDETIEAYVSAKLVDPIIVVAIANGGMARGDEYLPTRAKMGTTELGGKLDQFGKFVVEEVKPFIDSTYRTKSDRQNTGIGGSSFGGIMALGLALSHPKVFGKAAVHSPSVWWDSRVMLKTVSTLPKKPSTKLFIDVGTAEGLPMVQDARMLAAELEKKGWVMGRDMTLVVEQGGKHDEDAWARRAPQMLMFLFPNR